MREEEEILLADCSTDLTKISKTLVSLGNSVDLFGKYLTEMIENQDEKDGLGHLKAAASCVRAFWRSNFAVFSSKLSSEGEEQQQKKDFSVILCEQTEVERVLREEELCFGPIRPVHSAVRLDLLHAAKLLLLDHRHTVSHCPTADWWTMRLVAIWQRVLDQPVPQLKSLFEHYSDRFQLSSVFEQLSNSTKGQFLLELTHGLITYREYDGAWRSLQTAMDVADLRVQLVGKMGKRTRFQQRDIAQLCVQVNGGNNDHVDFNGLLSEFPVSCQLKDDTLLENISFEDKSTDSLHLDALQQGCLLTLFRYELQTQHNDELLTEKLMAYVEKVIAEPLCWATHFCALILRSRLERCQRRKLERACAQLESLLANVSFVDEMDEKQQCNVDTRWKLALAVDAPPVWQIRSLHAQLLMDLDLSDEALPIFEQLQMWDRVVDCYKNMGKLEQAERVIRKLIDQRPSDPFYYCLLGDITANEEYYTTAWEISNHRSSRAQISLGRLFYNRGRLEEAHDCLKRGLAIQPLQDKEWFLYGHIAWKLDRYQEAAGAYQRCVSIEPDNFEAWNNLATAYIRLKQKPRAFKILQEAVKYNSHDNWKFWENYLLVAVDTREFVEAVKSYHRLLDLKDKYEDAEVLEILALEALKQSRQSDSQLSELLNELFGRIGAKQTSSGRVWRAYAALNRPQKTANIEQYEKFAKLLQRTFQATIQQKDWEKTVEGCVEAMNDVIELAQTQLHSAELKVSQTESSSQLKQSARLNLRKVMATVRRQYSPIEDHFDCNLLDQVDKLFSRLVSE